MSIQKDIKEKIELKSPKYSEILIKFIEDIDDSKQSENVAKKKLERRIDDLVIKEEKAGAENDN